MDATKLVVGQEVYMFSEVYTCTGKVIKVTPEGVEVRATVQSNLTRVGDLLHFDNSGKGRDDEGTHECGAWQLVNPYSMAIRLSGLVTGEENKEEFEDSELYREICSLAQQAGGFPWREDSFLGPGLAFWSCSEIGHVAACGYVEDGEFPGSPPVDLTDKKYEKLVETLRSINGQFVWRFEKNCFPLFYYENLQH
jgi:hypothetical protein